MDNIEQAYLFRRFRQRIPLTCTIRLPNQRMLLQLGKRVFQLIFRAEAMQHQLFHIHRPLPETLIELRDDS